MKMNCVAIVVCLAGAAVNLYFVAVASTPLTSAVGAAICAGCLGFTWGRIATEHVYRRMYE